MHKQLHIEFRSWFERQSEKFGGRFYQLVEEYRTQNISTLLTFWTIVTFHRGLQGKIVLIILHNTENKIAESNSEITNLISNQSIHNLTNILANWGPILNEEI